MKLWDGGIFTKSFTQCDPQQKVKRSTFKKKYQESIYKLHQILNLVDQIDGTNMKLQLYFKLQNCILIVPI